MDYIKDKFIVVLLAILVIAIASLLLFKPSYVNIVHTRPKVNTVIQKTDSTPKAIKELPSKGPLRVSRVIDGDTFTLENGETIRLIGIDTPELHHSEIPVQRFAKEAADYLKNMIEGLKVTLEFEPDNLKDPYGRLLAYVYINGVFVNKEMIRRGYAYAYTRFPFKHQQDFLEAEKEAIEKQYGLWNLSLRDGRITNIIKHYENMNLEGRKRFEILMDSLVKTYKLESKEN